MLLSALLTISFALSVLWGLHTGRAAAVSAALFEGTGAAVELILSMGGIICFWSALMEVMTRSGLTAGLSRMLNPLLCRLFPSARKDSVLQESLSLNMAANLLGLGNAATPAGLRALSRMADRAGSARASNEMCRLVILNTASIQFIPTTVAALRAAAGARQPFDILPAVWISSISAVSVGLLCARLLEGHRP